MSPRVVLTALGCLGLAAALLGMLARYWYPRSLYSLLMAAISPYLGLGAVLALVLFAIRRGTLGWIGVVASAVVLVWFVSVQAPLFAAARVPPGRDVVVLTANLRLGSADPSAVVAAVRAHHVDVLMLEELTPEEWTALRDAGLSGLLPYGRAVPMAGGSGAALLSRWPVDDAQLHGEFRFAFVTARVRVPDVDGEPTVVALHMYGPQPASQTQGWVQDMDRLPAVLDALPRGAPVLVGGDFNATSDVAQFRRLLHGGYADAAEQAGAGWTPTYPANRLVPLLSIDHVLTRDAVARTADSVRLPGSDHRGLLVTVRLPYRDTQR